MSIAAQDPDEVFDVVDASNRVIGRERRAVIHARGLLHRAAHLLWIRGDGLLCLQRRSFRKDSCPGLISTSCAGHLDAGEGYLAAMVRELREENGVEVSPSALSQVEAVPAHPDLGNEFVEVFVLRGDHPFRIHPPEVDALLWRSPAEADAWSRAQSGLFSTSFLHLLACPAVRAALGLSRGA
jgi:isopentenyldiphosphate isomerase